MSKILVFPSAEAGFPPRASYVVDETPLVLLFARQPDLLPFVRYLFNEYQIFTVADWDGAPTRLLSDFPLSDHLRMAFKNKIGRAQIEHPAQDRVVTFQVGQGPS